MAELTLISIGAGVFVWAWCLGIEGFFARRQAKREQVWLDAFMEHCTRELITVPKPKKEEEEEGA